MEILELMKDLIRVKLALDLEKTKEHKHSPERKLDLSCKRQQPRESTANPTQK